LLDEGGPDKDGPDEADVAEEPGGSRFAAAASPVAVSHTTVVGIVPCLFLIVTGAPAISTRPRTVVLPSAGVSARVFGDACSPPAPAHAIATQIRIFL
jgi:hypothetical protein